MKLEVLVNCREINENISNFSRKYILAKPFPHIVIDNFLNPDCLENTLKGFKKVDWAKYTHFNENKSGNKTKTFDPSLQSTINALNSKEFLLLLEKITGISSLIPDHELGSGGVHRSSRGGFLNIHADFTVHPYKKKWHRRVNVLVYLNDVWDESWGGHLELWDKKMTNCVKKIAPILNRCVIFNTDYDSFHGHPEPMTCPENIYRKSIALYYYTYADKNVKTVATNYKSRPNDNFLKKIMIFVDKSLIGVFHFIKSKFQLSDRLITRIFDFLNSRK